MRLCAALLATFLVSGCEAAGDEAELDDYTQRILDEYKTPHYTTRAFAISGIYVSAIETSEIYLCKDRSACELPRNVDGSVQPCWVDFRLEEKGETDMITEDGSFWMEGRGRIAVLPGSFGHLGSYTCQVEMTEITELTETRGPFDPPPPPDQ